jgi:Na+/proline symporter
MKSIDYAIIFIYFLITIVIGLWYSRQAGKSLDDFFLSGRKLPWWLSGISMAATTFAADTPLAVTGIVAAGGIAGNWFWWGYAVSGILTVFIFSRMWRKVGVLTDAEFTEVRYEGKAAAFLRVFRAIYFAIPINIIIMGWVGLGMSKVIHVAFGWPKEETFMVLYILTGIYVVFSGLWGVVLTDFIQFFVAMGGSIVLAIFAVDKFGSLENLKAAYILTGKTEASLSANPFAGFGIIFFVWLFVQWWSTWFPGAEPGGGGYIAQRIFSVKNEKDAVKASLLFNILHYVFRPWPWIIVTVASMAMYPELKDPELGYPMAMVDLLPAGLLGLLIVSFLAAYMSTLSTHLNWGASYLVNDFYKRILRKDADQKELIQISRAAIVLLLVFTYIISKQMSSVKEAWVLLVSIGSGTGLVYMIRWFWKRVNPWSEISAMISALVFSLGLKLMTDLDSSEIVLVNTVITTTIWIIVTLLTRPVTDSKWKSFREKSGLRSMVEKKYFKKPGIPGVLLSLASIFLLLGGLNDLLFFSNITGIVKSSAGLIFLFLTVKVINKMDTSGDIH